jgi:hypothetical protein
MEQIPPATRRAPRLLIVATLIIAVVVLAAAWIDLHRLPAARLAGAGGVPRVHLKVAVLDEQRRQATGDSTRIGGDAPLPAETPTSPQATPQAVTPQPTAEGGGWPWSHTRTATPEPAEREARMQLQRAPIAISIYVRNGPQLVEWAEHNPTARELLDSELFRGVFQDLRRTLGVRGEDLKIPGVRGAFLAMLARDVLGAEAMLHYDRTRGRGGWVLAFRRERSPLAGRLLPLVLGATARRRYDVAAAQMEIVEALLGTQRVFVTELDGIVYAGTSLPALLNVVEVAPSPPPAGPGETLALCLRAEAWFRDFLPAVTGAREWQATWHVALDGSGSPGVIRTAGATAFGRLRPTLADGVLASIPYDVFAAAAASFPFPQPEGGTEENRPATEPAANEPAGIGVVWDLSAQQPALSEVGIIASAPQAAGAAQDLEAYVSQNTFAARCAQDTIWLASSNETLLARMREGCERQSKSMLDRQSGRVAGAPQVFLAFNPAAGFTEMLERGLSAAREERGETTTGSAPAPEWKASFDAARDRARNSARATIAKLPLFFYEGAANLQGAMLEGRLEWPSAPSVRSS